MSGATAGAKSLNLPLLGTWRNSSRSDMKSALGSSSHRGHTPLPPISRRRNARRCAINGVFGLGAAVLAAVAAVAVVAPDGGPGTVPFFVALTLGGAIHAWATAVSPVQGARRVTMLTVTGLWMIAAVWIGALLLLFQAWSGGSRGTPPPEVTYLGLSATVYHLVGLYGGLALVIIGTWTAQTRPASGRQS